MKEVVCVLLLGGLGVRMAVPIPKQFLPLADKPLFAHSLTTLSHFSEFSQIIIVVARKYQQVVKMYLSKNQRYTFCDPGFLRQDSLRNALRTLESSFDPLILVHDGARPLVSKGLIRRVLDGGKLYGSCAPALAITETVKKVDASHRVIQTMDRKGLFRTQTPQIALKSTLEKALSYAYQRQMVMTDELSLLELLGEKSAVVEGCFFNLKVTYASDIELCQKLLPLIT